MRVFVIFWDEYHIGRFAEAIKGRKALTTFVTTAFGGADLVALMDPLLPVDAIRFTRDRRELAEKIAKLEGRFGVYIPTRSAAEDNMLERRDVARVRSEVTISALRSAAVHLGSIKEGRKAIIFVSQGLTGLGMDQVSLIQELTDTANNNNTAIYTVDPSGLNGGSADVLRTIAESTGAEAFVNTNAPERGLRQVVREASAFYLLGYSSTRNPLDGKFHKIGVKVKRSGLDVRARRGYWAPNATEIEKARTEAAAAEAIPADVTGAMTVLAAARADRLVDVWAGADRGADGAGGDRGVDAASDGARQDATRTVAVLRRAPRGDQSFERDARRWTRCRSRRRPATLQLQVTVRDAAGNILDEDRRPLAVPDFSAAALDHQHAGAAARPDGARGARHRRRARGRRRSPAASSMRTDRVFVRFSVYGAMAGEADVSARLMNKAGATLLELPVTRLQGQGYQVELPTRRLRAATTCCR